MGLSVEIYIFLWLWKAFPAGTGFGDKNYPKACLRGVFSHKTGKRKALKPSKGFISIYLPKKTINHQNQIFQLWQE